LLQWAVYVSHVALEVGNNASKTDWTVCSYRKYRRLLDEESMRLNGIYAAMSLSVHTRKEAL
jgi:hypothetical protein